MVTPFVPFAPPAPPKCACGEPLALEMERDDGICVQCAAEAAGVRNEPVPLLHPIFERLMLPFHPSTFTPTRPA